MEKRILVVEDDLLNRMLLCASLEADGYDIRSVEDGALALDATRNMLPDLITMDINLPNVSGIDVIRQIKADPELRTIPILAITAYVGMVEESDIRAAGAAHVLAKPISIQPFLGVVGDLLAGGSRE